MFTLDYKEKGTLPQVPQEGNSHFYEQGKYSCLGVCIHTRSGNKTERHFVNFLLPHTNQTGIVTYLTLKKLWNMEVVSKDKPMHFWFDSCTHFQNITVITEVLSHPRVFEKVGSNGLGASGSCPIPDVNFLFIYFFYFNRPKGRQ